MFIAAVCGGECGMRFVCIESDIINQYRRVSS